MSDQQPPVPPLNPEPPLQPQPQPQPQQAEWIPVPPQNPFAQGALGRPGKGLGIAAMCVGLVALLTALTAALYLPPAAILGGVLGLAALILGVIALIKKQRPRATWITGLATGALSLLLGLAVGAMSLGALAIDVLRSGTAGTDSSLDSGDWQEHGEAQPSLIEWPANMATGGIVFGEQLDPRRSDPLAQGEAPGVSEVNRDSGVLDIRLYVDYRCPYCSLFEQANGPALSELVSGGAATLELVPLTFLDRVSGGSYYSSRASAAVACVVDSQPESAWAAHATLLDPSVQPTEGNSGLSNAELFTVLDNATGGLGAAVEDCISTERFVPFAQALNTWVFSNPVPGALDAGLQVSGTPFAVVNGVPYEGDPADAAAFAEFLAQIAGY